MKAPEFEGPMDPIAADNWLIDIQVILDFMRLTEQEKMFRTDISKQVSTGSSPLTLVSDCVSQAIRAEYWINQDKEARAQIFKAKKEEKAVVKQMQPRQNMESSLKGLNINSAQSSKQFGRNKRKGNFTGQETSGSMQNGDERLLPLWQGGALCKELHSEQPEPNPPYPSQNANSQLHAVQARIEGPSISQGRLEAPEPQVRIYPYTKGDAEAGTSHVVTVRPEVRKRCG
ncbi:hypothetical protein TIFTF001_020290 [Ficus carica]|uniref:Uncharacterized protein n=1 Tax=Ficus carica TaxID=3494 RepID=A0AA88ADE1_FICCA|nr:hypothetical protein TIFTF001_020290 [Ficus carica]